MQRFLATLLGTLEGAGIRPIILRNYENLPLEIGNDLDIFIEYSRWREAEELLRFVCRSFVATVIHRHQRGYFTALWIQFGGAGEPLHIDLYPGAGTWHGIPFLSECRLISGAVKQNGYFVPRPAHEAAISTFASLLWGGRFKMAYHAKIRALLSDASEMTEFADLVGTAFPGDAGGNLVLTISRGNPSLLTRSTASALRRALRRSSFTNDPTGTLRNWASHWLHELACWLNPPGRVVSIGSNRTDFASAASSLCEETASLFGGVLLMEQSPGVNPLSWFKILRHASKNHLVIVPGRHFRINRRMVDVSRQSLAKALIESTLHCCNTRSNAANDNI